MSVRVETRLNEKVDEFFDRVGRLLRKLGFELVDGQETCGSKGCTAEMWYRNDLLDTTITVFLDYDKSYPDDVITRVYDYEIHGLYDVFTEKYADKIAEEIDRIYRRVFGK